MNGSGVCVLDLDDKWNIVGVDWLGFTQVKKNSGKNAIYYKKADYPSRFALTDMMIREIKKKAEGCTYAAIEDFAYGAAGQLADIGQFVGQVARELWLDGIGLRWYGPSLAKKSFTGRGTADKVGMYEAYLECKLPKPDLTGCPIPTTSKGVSPTSDVIDAYAHALLLRKELMIRSGALKIEDLDKKDKELFGKKKKSTILEEDFDFRLSGDFEDIPCNPSNFGEKRSGKDIKYIVVHYTAGSKDTARGNGLYFQKNKVKASAHYFADSKGIVRSVQEDAIAWHCGGAKQGTDGGSLFGVCKNGNSIGIELCNEDGRTDFIPNERTLANAAKLVRYLMSKYGIPKENIVRHFDVNGKKCPLWGVDDAEWRRLFLWRI